MQIAHLNLTKIVTLSLFAYIAMVSCHQRDNAKDDMFIPKKPSPKLKEHQTISEILDTLDHKKNILHLDISNLALEHLPDLSSYEIESLDLSHNALDTILISRLPKNLKKLKCTHNKLNSFTLYTHIGGKNKYANSELNLEEIDLSHNNLKSIHYHVWDLTIPLKRRNQSCQLTKANFSNNHLTYVSINTNCERLNYLDLSNNATLSNVFDFDITKIKTVERQNIKNNLPLKMKRFPQPVPMNCG